MGWEAVLYVLGPSPVGSMLEWEQHSSVPQRHGAPEGSCTRFGWRGTSWKLADRRQACRMGRSKPEILSLERRTSRDLASGTGRIQVKSRF